MRDQLKRLWNIIQWLRRFYAIYGALASLAGGGMLIWLGVFALELVTLPPLAQGLFYLAVGFALVPFFLALFQIVALFRSSRRFIEFYEDRFGLNRARGLLEELRSVEVAWACWYTGSYASNQEIFGRTRALRRLILLHPEGEHLATFAGSFERTAQELASEIRITTRRAQASGVDVRWYDGPAPGLLIAEPKGRGGWIRMEYLLAQSAERPSVVVVGREFPELFKAICGVYEALWDKGVKVVVAAHEGEGEPVLELSDSLEMDSGNKMFRLRVTRRVGGAEIEPKVAMTEVRNDKGEEVVPSANLPIELHWSHHPRGERAKLVAKGDSETVGVVMRGSGPDRLYITGMGIDYPIETRGDWSSREPVYMRVVVRHPDSAEEGGTRWFLLMPDKDSTVGYVAGQVGAAPPFKGAEFDSKA